MIRFADDDKDDDRREENEGKDSEKEKDKDMSKNKPTSLQQKMLAMAGQDIDQFMKEMEVVHKKRETERAQDLNARLSMLDSDTANTDKDHQHEQGSTDLPSNLMPTMNPPTQPQPPMPLMGLPPPPPLMYRPPPLHLRMPPPPPPRMGMRLPPGNKKISLLEILIELLPRIIRTLNIIVLS